MLAEHLPVFALPDDSIVEIQGEPEGLQKAVELIATHLRKFLVDRSVIGIFETQASNKPIIFWFSILFVYIDAY